MSSNQPHKAWERLERLINDLHDYANPRPNVHKEIKKKIDNIGSAFKRLKTLEGVPVTQQHATFVASQAVGTPKMPKTPCVRTFAEVTSVTSAIDTDTDAAVES